MGQKKHHQSSLRTTTLVTTRSRAAKLAARPDKTHGSIESEKRLLPRTQPRPVAEDEIFALPFLHAPTRDHSVYNLSRDEDTHGVPPHRPSASEWATCYGLSKIFNRTQKWHPQKQDASASTATVPHLHQEHPADSLPPRAVQLFWSRTGTLRPRCASTLDTGSSPMHQFSTSPVQCWLGVAYSPWSATVTGRKITPQESNLRARSPVQEWWLRTVSMSVMNHDLTMMTLLHTVHIDHDWTIRTSHGTYISCFVWMMIRWMSKKP